MEAKTPNILESFILSYDPKMTRSLPKKHSDDLQMIAFTSGKHEYTMSRASVFNTLSYDNNHNLVTFGISNEELKKALEDTEHRFEAA